MRPRLSPVQAGGGTCSAGRGSRRDAIPSGFRTGAAGTPKPPGHRDGRTGIESGAVEGFEAHRGHLWGVAYRILGTTVDADDAVQETWLR
ncbi:hypothetical protein GCM10010412_040880 [Nonomuraea recticatena]|uniref:RNA polymerase sigma-70 region 2 domain-containing protein n=1 Tax=Nonomuraea recticatena TaxID=46178 RepID=A0ABP6EF34_9ACTN